MESHAIFTSGVSRLYTRRAEVLLCRILNIPIPFGIQYRLMLKRLKNVLQHLLWPIENLVVRSIVYVVHTQMLLNGSMEISRCVC